MKRTISNIVDRGWLTIASVMTILVIIGCMAEGAVCFALVRQASSTVGSAGFVVLGILLFGVALKLLVVWLDALRVLWPRERDDA